MSAATTTTSEPTLLAIASLLNFLEGEEGRKISADKKLQLETLAAIFGNAIQGRTVERTHENITVIEAYATVLAMIPILRKNPAAFLVITNRGGVYPALPDERTLDDLLKGMNDWITHVASRNVLDLETRRALIILLQTLHSVDEARKRKMESKKKLKK